MKSFSHHIERWRNEPEAKRQRRALFLASSVTICLFVLWLASFRLSANLRGTPTVPVMASVGSVTTVTVPAHGIVERIQAGWQALTKQF